jgi:uncharacterized protein (DUF697 family)
VAAVLAEARGLVGALREDQDQSTGARVVVSGMLSEQLAKELGAGAEPGTVIAGDATRLREAGAIVHVMAGEPSLADEALVREADALGVPVVLVQLWPQDEWTPPFVLTPFVVECRAGEGFPVAEIASRIVDACGPAPALARRAPVLRETVVQAVLRSAAIRSALIGATAGPRASRPLLTLEQVRLLAELHALRRRPAEQDRLPPLAAPAVATVAAGFLFRAAARSAGRVLPAPLVNGAVAAAATWALGTAFRRFEARLD